MLEAVSDLADFVRCYEPVFLFMLAEQNSALRKQELQTTKNRLEQSRKRIAEIDRVISRIYEDNLNGKLSDERFFKMSAAYEAEQKDLEKKVTDCERELQEADKASVDLHMLLKGLLEFTELRELTPTIVNTLIRRIEVHNNDKYDGHCHVKVDIYFTAIGMIDLPSEQEIKKMMNEIKANPQQHRLTA